MIHMMKRCLPMCLAGVLLLTAVDPALADRGKVKGASLVLRQEPDRSAKALYTLNEDAALEIIGKDDGWYKVRYGKFTGFVDAKYVTVTEKDKDDTLCKGDWGSDVRKLQQRLKALGYFNAEVDGDYGAKTVAAVKAFQERNGLTVDGVAGPTTMKKMNASSAVKAEEEAAQTESETLRKGDSGAAVRKLQQRLKELGYFPSSVDGDYGEKTVAAVKDFQKANGLTADGVAGPSTQRKLYAFSAAEAEKEDTKEEQTDTLRKGDAGEAVRKLQRRLKELGYFTSSVDGDYGEKTVSAVKAFQRRNGLSADGVAGAATLKRLNGEDAVVADDDTDGALKTNQTLESGSSGPQVGALQQRLQALGYYTDSIDSEYGYLTMEAVSAFQRANGLTVNGTANPATLRKLISSGAVGKNDVVYRPGTIKTERLDWFEEGQTLFPRRAVIQVKDVRTGLIFKAQVLYGTNHLDAEPLTKADTAILLRINGGSHFSWRRRPMLVKYKGHVYAASIYSEPHGEQLIMDNNFDGQFCLHFYGSMTHGTDEVKQDHQECIAEAMSATW